MSWLKFDDTFPDHPKVLSAGTDAPLVIALQVRAIAYASRHQTDGFIPAAFVVLASRDLDELAHCRNCSGDISYNSARWSDQMITLKLWEKADGGFIIHDYLEYQQSRKEIAKALKQRRLASRRGGAATKAAWGPEGRPSRPGSRPTSRRGPIPSHPIPIDPKDQLPTPTPPAGRGASDSDFERFWTLYPKKKSKGEAEKAWDQLRRAKTLPPHEALASCLDRLRNSPDWTRDGGRFIPYPATWLRARGWLDEASAAEEPWIPPEERHTAGKGVA
ncbi:MAG TPA: hypothetical protein VNH84_05680 [Candidatus Saccharimonadales bacterium]|nr:hypothetical protein [Candidatus Saccharimonadales bacterium]